MPVHPNSVITTDLQTISQSAYDKLTDMENYCYEDSTQTDGNEENYKPFFEDLNSAIEGYLNQSIAVSDEKDYIMALYQLLQLNRLYGTGQSIIDDGVGAFDIYTIGTYLQTLEDYDVEDYDDIEEVEDDEEPGTFYFIAPTIEGDTDYINSSATSDDQNDKDDIESSVIANSSGMIYNLLFEDRTQQNSSYTKQELYDLIFETYSYKDLYELFGVWNDMNPKN